MSHLVYALMAGLCVALGCMFAALAQGHVAAKACESIARQPEMSGDIRFTMIIGLAMIESLAIYCLLIALVLLFVRW
ncbi:MAG: ATP synthase F0 subunit C [Candidatus Riflebacteria bacterium]|nr:ATP synthase F0 subunit C [Candidatus Riflebacteria bacterium]